MEQKHESDKEIKENDTVSFSDVLKNVNKEIVLVSKIEGNKDLKCCTYNKGYITQELFSCNTCFKEKAELAAICVSCSLNCHKDHDLNHLYFKRNFKCDCGNSKFDIPCALQVDKDYNNPENIYNHNFEGKYCICNQEDDGSENMVQCIICEDWYHNKHLDIEGERLNDEEGELICKKCLSEKLLFLKFYPTNQYFKNLISQPSEKIHLENEEKSENAISPGKRKFDEAFKDESNENNFNSSHKKLGHEDKVEKTDKVLNLKEIISNTEQEENHQFCKLKAYKQMQENNNSDKAEKDVFVDVQKLSSMLCRCDTCLEIYKESKVSNIHTPEFYNDWNNRELIEDVLSQQAEEDNPDNQDIISSVDNINLFNYAHIKNLPVEKQIEFSLVMKNFTEKLKEFLHSLPRDQTVTVQKNLEVKIPL